MPLILETPDESRWAEEIAELKRFWELSCENICRI